MNSVSIVEMSLRDGLQNEATNLSIDDRVELANRLFASGLRRIELGAFVRSDWVPQMAGSKEVIEKIFHQKKSKVQYSALVPNEHGMLEALKTPIKEVAVFAACSETFSNKNINCSIDESFKRFDAVFTLAKKNKMKVRGYLSTCFGCPYEGKVAEKKVIQLALRLSKMGCYEVSIGDTIGVATPKQIESVFKKLIKIIPAKKLAGHFHDTRGTALANILTSYRMGIRVFDSSLGGLGGCPYAPGAAGNVSTEDVVFMFNGMGIKTGINLEKLIETSKWLSAKMNKKLYSKVTLAGVGPLVKFKA